MADARYVIDLILNARDETGRALQSFTQGLESARAAQRGFDEDSKRIAQSQQALTREIKDGQKELLDSYKELGLKNKDAVDAQVKLEQASRNYVRTLGDVNKSEAEHQQALQAVTKAERDLADVSSRAHAERIKNINYEIEQNRLLLRTKEQMQRDEERAKNDAERKDRERIARGKAFLAETLREEAQIVQQHNAKLDREDEADAKKRRQRRNVEKQQEKDDEKERRDRLAAGNQFLRNILAEDEQLRRAHNARLDRENAREDQERKQRQNREKAQIRDQIASEQTLVQEREKNLRRISQLNKQAGRERMQEIQQMKRDREEIGRQIETLSNDLMKTARGSDDFKRVVAQVRDLRMEYVRLGGDAKDAWDIQRNSMRGAGADVNQLRTDMGRYQDLLVQIRRQEEAARNERERPIQMRMELDSARARAEAAELAATLRASLSHIEANVDLDTGEFSAQAAEVMAMKELIGKDIKFHVEADVDNASIARIAALKSSADDSGSTLKQLFSNFTTGLHSSSQQIAAFDNFMRGLFVFAITVFIQQLFVIAGAAAGALMALASSALSAGMALGGALTAGAAQAIPVIGLLATAFSRVKAAIDAASQAQLLQQQQSYKGAQQTNQQATRLEAIKNATDQVKNAQEALARAHERVADAQKNVTDAREQARRKLEDLILAEKEAILAAKGAAISQEEAQRALRRAIAEGQTADIAGRQLGTQEAGLNVQKANQSLTRTRSDLTTRRSAGIEGSPEVTQAARQLKDAQRAVEAAQRGIDQANRSLDHAKRNSDIAAANITAAQGKLDFLLSRMSKAEVALYEAISKLQNVWRKFAQEVTEPIIVAFTDAISRVITLLKTDEIIATAKSLSTEIAAQFRRIFDDFTSDGVIKQFLRIADQAKANLKPVADIIINLGHAFLNVAEIANPAFKKILDWVSDLSLKLRVFTESKSGRNWLAQMFDTGVTALKSWVDLLGAIGRLFLAITGEGGGAKAGIGMLDAMTKKINDWSKEIENVESKTSKFFRRFFALSAEILAALGPIFAAIGKEFEKTFNRDGVNSVKGFSTFLANVVIPGLGKFLRTLGHLTAQFGNLISQHPQVAKFFATFLGAVLVSSVIARLFSVFKPFIEAVKFGVGVVRNFGAIWGDAVRIFTKVEGGLQRALALLGRFIPGLTRLSTIGLGPFALIAGGIIFLLAKLGLLDDALGVFKTFFMAIWEQVRPPVERLIKSFQRLFDAFGQGKGAFALLKPILTILIQIAGYFAEGFGRAIGKVIGGLIDVISGFVNLVVSLLSGDFGGAWEAIKQIVTGVARAIIGVIEFVLLRGMGRLFTGGIKTVIGFADDFVRFLLRAGRDGVGALLRFLIRLPGRVLGILKDAIAAARRGGGDLIEFFGRLGVSIFERLQRGFGRLFDFFKALPGKLWNFVKGIPEKLADAFRGVGGKIIAAMFAGIVNIAGVGRDIINSLIDLINTAIPNKIHVPGPMPDIPLPDNPIPKFAKGGPVPGSGDGDIVPALLTPGEHVWTKGEVAAAGGHGVLFALRRLFGGGSQGGVGGKFALGGAVQNQDARGTASIDASIAVNSNLEDFVKNWKLAWNEIFQTTRRSAIRVRNELTDLREDSLRIFNRLGSEVERRWERLVDSASTQADLFAETIRASFQDLQQTVYRAMRYIVNTTNDSLKAFDADPVRVSLDAPSDGGGSRIAGSRGPIRAASGWIGSQGERGGDDVPIWVGRGEAVLNWIHQRAIEPALQAYYGFGLHDLFGRMGGLHTGTKAQQMGFAKGGFTGPFGAGAAFNAISNFAKNKFGLQMTAGKTNHSTYTATGNVSDHSKGLAGDFSNGVLTPQEDAFSSFWKNRLPQTVKQLIWRNKDQFQGFPVGGHENHVHLAVKPEFAFNLSRMAKLISRAMRGLSVADLLAGAGGDADHVDKVGIKGGGPFIKGINKAIERVRRAANTFIDGKFADSGAFGGAVNYDEHGKGALSQSQVQSVFRRALDTLNIKEQVGKWVSMLTRQAWRESGFNPNAQNNWDINAKRGDPSIGLLQTIGATFRRFMMPGHNNIRNPFDNALAAIRYMVSTYGGGDPNRAVNVMMARGGGGYARGGFVGGFRPFGRYAGGGGDTLTSRQKRLQALKTGTYDLPDIDPRALDDLIDEFGRLAKALRNLPKKNKLDKFIHNIRQVTDEGGLLEQFRSGIERFSTNLENRLSLAQVGLRKVGNKLRSRPPLTDAYEIANQTVDNATRILDMLGTGRTRTRRNLDRTMAQIRKLRQGGISQSEEGDYQALIAARNKFWDELNQYDADIATKRADRFQAVLERFQAGTDRALKGINAVASSLNLSTRIANALGLRGADGTPLSEGYAQAQIDNLKDQRKVIENRLRAATSRARRDPRWQAVVDQLTQQLGDLDGQIAESTAQLVQSRITNFENQINRSTAALDRSGRRADLRERIGDRMGAARARIDVAQQRSGVLAGQLQGYEQLRAFAMSRGDMGAVESLTDKIEDLKVSIDEQNAATREATLAYRDAATAMIRERGEIRTGLLGTADSIFQKLGEITGSPQTAALLAVAEAVKSTLSTQAGEIARNISDAIAETGFGDTGNGLLAQLSTAFQQGPESFGNALIALNDQIAAFELTLGPADLATFQSLIQGMQDNTLATLDNTQTIDQLNGSMQQPQSWSSTAWQWFREAIFNGMGDVMPQYQVPQMQTGGFVTKGGLFDLHTGEFVVNAEQSNLPNTGGDINVEINEAGSPIDIQSLVSRLAFEKKTRGL